MAKPKIDLSDPRARAAIEAYKRQSVVALNIASTFDDAVRPLFALNQRTNKVEHEGSCVLLIIANHFFALSASHVFDAVGEYELLIGCGSRLHSLAGERFSSLRGPSGTHRDDPIDASVFHITADVPPEVRACALSLANLDLVVAKRADGFFVASGYRVSQSRATDEGHSTELERFPSLELGEDHYAHYRCQRDVQLLLAFEDQVLVDMKWQTAPSIRGFSGGAMFRIDGVSVGLPPQVTAPQAKLAAILIERRKGERNAYHSVAVGTRLSTHFGLIHKFLPGIHLEALLEEEFSRQGGRATD